MKYLRLGILLGALALMMAPLTGCGGAECGAGTTEEGDKCVPAGELVSEDVCSDGTVLMDGACVVDDSGCADGTVLENGTCVPEPGFCDEGTTWDAGQEQCVANTEIVCGEGTVGDDAGQCVPAFDDVCGPKTAVDSEGRCVIQADACADGEIIEPNSGDCVATDTYCSPSTAFDVDSDTCVPTEDVCDSGTKFDADSRLCLPDACKEGDVLLDYVCVSPAEELAANADLVEAENNDPSTGGTAETLTLKAIGETTAFTGTIDAPSDLDGDGNADQDLDVFEFDATAGQWFQLAVQSTGLPAPAFIVEGPEGYTRYSPLGRTADPARQLAIPRDGTYTVTVLPALVLQSGGDIGPSGDAEWGYVGTVEEINMPTATDVDLTANNITGSYEMLSDNLFNATGFNAGDIISVTFEASGEDADGLMQIWSNATEFSGEVEVQSGTTTQVVVPASGNLLLLFDWRTITGPELDFEISAELGGDFENIGPIGDDASATSTPVAIDGDSSYQYAFTVGAGQAIELYFDNDQSEEVKFWLRDATGNLLMSDTWVDVLSDTNDTDYSYWYAHDGGTFVLEVAPQSSSDDLTNAVTYINTMTPNDLGAFNVGDDVTANVPASIDEDRSSLHVVTANEALLMTGDVTTPADEDVDVYVYDETYTQIASHTSSGSVTIDDTVLTDSGVYVIRVQASEDVPSYDISLDFAEPPLLEQEPNDTDAQANTFDITRTLRGSTNATNEVDVYTFTVPSDLASDEVFLIGLTSLTSGSDEYRCELRDSSGTALTDNGVDGSEDGCLLMATGLLASETYYFEIERASYSDLDEYEIWSSIETGVLEGEPNDTEANATSFDLDTLIGGTQLYGIVPLNTDTDYFSFTLSTDRDPNELLTFDMARLGPNPTSTVDWRLLDGSSTELATGDHDDPLEVTGLTAGTYYVEVTRTSSSTGFTGHYTVSATSEIPVCGNGTIETGETCDDGNTVDGDGCTSSCQLGTPTTSATNNTSETIDSSNASFTKSVTISACTGPIWAISVDVDITHSYRGDLELELVSPTGTPVMLHDNSGSFNDDIVGNYPETLTVDGPGSLADYNGENGNGVWNLNVTDTYPSYDHGTFNSYTVNLYCN